MAAPVVNLEVENCLREILGQEGFRLNPQRAHGQTGVDIVATNMKGKAYHIEVVGYKAEGPTRAKDFYEGFFRIVSPPERWRDALRPCAVAPGGNGTARTRQAASSRMATYSRGLPGT